MQERTESGAWIEPVDGRRIGIEGTCSIGRAPSNQVVLAHEKVSRRHAVIHAQEQNEFWLVDLGSSNGTYLNGRRVTQSIQLHDADRIEIGPFCLMFGQPEAARTMTPDQVDIDKTVHDIKSAHGWQIGRAHV